MTNYIGRDLDKISNIEILDNITFDGSQSYTLQKGGVNFTPNSAQSIILGIDGITQIGNFSVNGSTIDFGVAVANTSTCNYIIHLGTGLLTAPSDGSVTNAKLGTAPTLEAKGSGSTAGGVRYFCEQSSHHVTLRAGQHSGFSSGSFELKLPTAQGGANTFLKNDGSGNLSFAEAGGDNTPVFMATRSGGDQTIPNATYTLMQFNNEIIDSDSAYDNSAYSFTVPSNKAGTYLIGGQVAKNTAGSTDRLIVRITKTTSGSETNFLFGEAYSKDYTKATSSKICTLAVGDILKCYGYQNTGGSIPIEQGEANSFFFAIKL